MTGLSECSIQYGHVARSFPFQQTANTTGMAHTSGNDRRELSHSVGVTTARAEPRDRNDHLSKKEWF